MKLSLKPFSKGLRSLEAEPQVAIHRWRNPLLKPGVRPGFQFKTNKKSRSAERETFRPPFMTWPNKSATALRENVPPGHFLNP